MVDDIDPVVVFSPAIELAIAADRKAVLTPSVPYQGSTDNCPLSFTAERTEFFCNDLFEAVPVNVTIIAGAFSQTNVLNVTVTDAGHCVTCDPDIQPPDIVCTPALLLVNDGNAITVPPSIANATDNCGAPALSFNQTEVSCAEVPGTAIEVTARIRRRIASHVYPL